MATISFTFPASVANFLNLNVPGFASASGGGDTVAVQVPALPAPVVAGLADAGFQVPSGAASGAASGAPVVSSDAAVGLAQFAPAGLVPQGAALEDPNLAGANAVASNIAQAANAFFEQAAASGSIDVNEIASFAAQQQQAVNDYLFGG